LTVYVDDMRAKFGRMVMCHMIADTEEELGAMADRIGVQRKWWQYRGQAKSHFDIALSKRTEAIKAGAVPITWLQLSCMTMLRSMGEPMGDPKTAKARMNAAIERKIPDATKVA
jgi:hypothetical protein